MRRVVQLQCYSSTGIESCCDLLLRALRPSSNSAGRLLKFSVGRCCHLMNKKKSTPVYA
jgi:hypothetical protein